MLRGWLAVVAILLGISFSFAADSSSRLQQDRRWEEARKYLVDGKPGEAKGLFEELLKQYPNEADLHLFLGITQLRLRNPEAAVSAIKKALGENPSHADARTLLAWIELEVRGDFDAAIKEYQKVIELRPELAEAYSKLDKKFDAVSCSTAPRLREKKANLAGRSRTSTKRSSASRISPRR